MIDLKSVISLIEIMYLKKVSCIVRETKSDKKYFVIFDGEKNFKQIKLTNKDMKMVDAFRILNV
jgi:hypothetical protein